MSRLNRIMFAAAALIAALLAIANRASVTVSFDPLPPASEGLSVTAPLFLVIFAAMFCGILMGGFAVWLAQRKSRALAVVPPPAMPAVEGNAGKLTPL